MIEYVDFSSLLTIAIGLNAAYIFITRKDDNVFLAYLNSLTEKAVKNIVGRKTKELQEESELEAKLDFHLHDKDVISDQTPEMMEFKGGCNVYLDKLKTLRQKAESITSKHENNISMANEAKNLSKFATVATFYGIYVLLIAILEHKKKIDINESLLAVNALFIFYLILCVCWEYKCLKIKIPQKNKLKPVAKAINHCLSFLSRVFSPTTRLQWSIIIIALMASVIIINEITICGFDMKSWIKNRFGNILEFNPFITLFVCYAVFISYLFSCRISIRISSQRCNRELKSLNIDSIVQENKTGLNKICDLDELLKKIDQKILDQNLSRESFTVSSKRKD